MYENFKSSITKALTTLSGLTPWKRKPAKKIHTKAFDNLSRLNQQKLEHLCTELFKQKDMLTSGRLQMIGLEKIQKKLGKRWESLSTVVFETVDTVINNNIDKNDLFIRYKDDTYVLIFASSNLKEGKIKAARIASEIQKALFKLEEEELRNIEIRKAVSEVNANLVADKGFSNFLDSFTAEEIPFMEDADFLADTKDEFSLGEAPITSVDANGITRSSIENVDDIPLPEGIEFSYLPLWDSNRHALTTYLCTASLKDEENNDTIAAHKNLYAVLDSKQRIALDIRILEHVTKELEAIEEDGRQLLLACPVNYDTLYKYEDYGLYKKYLDKIPEIQRQFLIFFILNMQDERPPTNAYWFAKPLKNYSRHVCAKVPLRRDVNFTYLNNTGVDIAGIVLDKDTEEDEMINILNIFSAKAKKLRISQTFVLGLSSLSLTTSAICAGFDYLGGISIHEKITVPRTIESFKYKDILKDIIPPEE